jgi:hypothetical protein
MKEHNVVHHIVCCTGSDGQSELMVHGNLFPYLKSYLPG